MLDAEPQRENSKRQEYCYTTLSVLDFFKSGRGRVVVSAESEPHPSSALQKPRSICRAGIVLCVRSIDRSIPWIRSQSRGKSLPTSPPPPPPIAIGRSRGASSASCGPVLPSSNRTDRQTDWSGLHSCGRRLVRSFPILPLPFFLSFSLSLFLRPTFLSLACSVS